MTNVMILILALSTSNVNRTQTSCDKLVNIMLELTEHEAEIHIPKRKDDTVHFHIDEDLESIKNFKNKCSNRSK